MKKKVSKKKDLVPLVLYKLMFDSYMKTKNFQKELEEHLSEKYKLRKKGNHTKAEEIESLVCDCLYGSESEVEDFLKELKEKLIEN